jgi:hypothetical protein
MFVAKKNHMDRQDQVISDYESQTHDTTQDPAIALQVFKWIAFVLLWLVAIVAIIVAGMAYNNTVNNSQLTDAELVAVRNLTTKTSFIGNTLVAEGFSDEVGFLATENKVVCETVTATNVTVSSLEVLSDLKIDQNLLVQGFSNSNSSQLSLGMFIESSAISTVGTPSGTTAAQFSEFNSGLTKIIGSGFSGSNTAISSGDAGATWLQLTTPFSNPGIDFSGSVYSGIDIFGNAVYTSPTAANGSWVVGTAYSGTFDSGSPLYISAFGRFYASTTDPNNRIASALSPFTVYTPQSTTRNISAMAYSPSLHRVVAVGSLGPQYSDDGTTWIASDTTIAMSGVCFSGFWNKFVAVTSDPSLRVNIFTSVNGITWVSTNVGFNASNALRTIAWSDQFQIFVAAGDSSYFWVAREPSLWRKNVYNFSSFDCYGCRFYPEWGVFVAGSSVSQIAATPQLFAA